jgi:hypothetical protein
MKTILAALTLLILQSPAAQALCYSGEYTIADAKGAGAKMSFTLRDGVFNSQVLNPDDIFTNGRSQLIVSQAFRPDHDLAMNKDQGIKCPCDEFSTTDGRLMVRFEALGDNSIRTTINYFGWKTQVTSIHDCSEKAIDNTTPGAPNDSTTGR